MIKTNLYLQLEPQKAEKCAMEIVHFLIKNEMWIDTFIYVNGKCISCKDEKGNYHYENTEDCIFVKDNEDPKRYFEYVASEHILSMSFEGPLYEALNGYDILGNFSWSDKITAEFDNILNRYGYWYELGNAWNLTCYKQ